ncbi:LytTR family DNA-binding domain-containing protein [Carboxylicivirga sp. M1479]|uniref:LytR/AlgR family response regulator transcription factor n=1 Tax=Carboxylicivirga sp. M1479 TaxID=2594476 RepID=UPI001177C5AF|nr:LytTR family DNA-binding domain-containing protein [Carboxylicivirga sp. M1479]TRX63199.1 response regulator transcription factor [Carboxylicivirga sp. M1479]
MRVLIIEDEKPAVDNLKHLLNRYDNSIEVVGELDSIQASVEWFSNPLNTVDLVFMDIHLSDGLSFEIFNKTQLNLPVIFTTAYNEYAIQAFKVNSIDYLLKPLDYDDLFSAMEKLESLRENLSSASQRIKLEELNEALLHYRKTYKERFMVKLGERIKSVTSDKIVLFYAEGRNAFILTSKGNRYIIDYKLEELEELLNPGTFYRISRSFIVNINHIQDVLVHSNSRLKIQFEQPFDREVIVSREKVNHFKNWFSGSGI